MNSMNNIYEDLNSKFDILSVDYPIANQVAIDINQAISHTVLAYLKTKSFKQLSLLTCVDWPAENKFQLVFILRNWENGGIIIVRTKIDRENPKFRTITTIYPGAQYYERDVHEFFGVEFEGNEDSYKPLFLEKWDDMPPMRKDFDPQAYSDRKFPARNNDGSVFETKKVGE